MNCISVVDCLYVQLLIVAIIVGLAEDKRHTLDKQAKILKWSWNVVKPKEWCKCKGEATKWMVALPLCLQLRAT